MDASDVCRNLIDGVVVINLDSSTKRLEAFMSTTGALFPSGVVERISAVVGQEISGYGEAPWFTEATGDRASVWGGAAGCALSHRKAIKYAKQRGWKNVLIFEDDARLQDSSEVWEVLAKTLSSVQGRYLLYLGYNEPSPFGRKWIKGKHHDIWKVNGVLATHAYIVPASMYDLLLRYLPSEENIWEWLSMYKAIDVVYRDFLPLKERVSIYAIYPVACSQGVAYSDIKQIVEKGESRICKTPPSSIFSLKAMTRVWFPWLQLLKNKLNSIRTHRRALKGGLPGYHKTKN